MKRNINKKYGWSFHHCYIYISEANEEVVSYKWSHLLELNNSSVILTTKQCNKNKEQDSQPWHGDEGGW